MGQVFISYPRAERAYVGRLLAHLRQRGIDVSFDEDIPPGHQWDQHLRDTIETSAAVVIVMTPATQASTWVTRELNHAEEHGKPLFPLLLRGERLFRLNHLQYEDVRNGVMPSDRFIAQLNAATNTATDLDRIPRSTNISGSEASGIEARTNSPPSGWRLEDGITQEIMGYLNLMVGSVMASEFGGLLDGDSARWIATAADDHGRALRIGLSAAFPELWGEVELNSAQRILLMIFHLSRVEAQIALDQQHLLAFHCIVTKAGWDDIAELLGRTPTEVYERFEASTEPLRRQGEEILGERGDGTQEFPVWMAGVTLLLSSYARWIHASDGALQCARMVATKVAKTLFGANDDGRPASGMSRILATLVAYEIVGEHLFEDLSLTLTYSMELNMEWSDTAKFIQLSTERVQYYREMSTIDRHQGRRFQQFYDDLVNDLSHGES